MPWPPTLPVTGRTNTTPAFDNHPGDHNTIAQALADIAVGLVRRVGANSTTTQVAGIGAAESVNLVSTQVDVKAGRKYRVTLYVPVAAGTVAADVFNWRIYTGATNVTNSSWSVPVANGGGPLALWTEYAPGADAAALTFALRVLRASGTGTLTAGGKAGDPMRIAVDDVGTL